jgi:hypothetical protein
VEWDNYMPRYPTNPKVQPLILVAVLVAVASIVSIGIYSSANIFGVSASAASPLTVSSNDTYTAQKTAMSNAGKLPIHQTHQVVTVLPPRSDDKVWVGTISWASSKPIELEMWHFFNSTLKPDSEHGIPVTTPYQGGNKTLAFSLLKQPSGTSLPSGTANFAASELSFHTLDGSKYTVAYTVDAVAKKLNQ